MLNRWTKAVKPKLLLRGIEREVILSINLSPATTAQRKVLLKWIHTQRIHLSLTMSIQRYYRVIRFYPTNSLGRELQSCLDLRARNKNWLRAFCLKIILIGLLNTTSLEKAINLGYLFITLKP